MSRLSADPKFQSQLIRGLGWPAYKLSHPAECGCPVRQLRTITNYVNSNPLAKTTDPAAVYLQAAWGDITAIVERLCDAIHVDHAKAVEDAWELQDTMIEALARAADQEAGKRHAG